VFHAPQCTHLALEAGLFVHENARVLRRREYNQVWAGDITYLGTGEGWMYLAVVMDLYSRRIVGWHLDKRMTTDLVNNAVMKAYNLRQPGYGVVFHSDRGSQYTSKRFQKLLSAYDIRSSMGHVGIMRL
jgi:putative transposase